jgi:hypothetical protein
VIFQRPFSCASVTAPFGLSIAIFVTLSRSTSTTALSRSTATFFGTAFQASSGISITADSPARMA